MQHLWSDGLWRLQGQHGEVNPKKKNIAHREQEDTVCHTGKATGPLAKGLAAGIISGFKGHEIILLARNSMTLTALHSTGLPLVLES